MVLSIARHVQCLHTHGAAALHMGLPDVSGCVYYWLLGVLCSVAGRQCTHSSSSSSIEQPQRHLRTDNSCSKTRKKKKTSIAGFQDLYMHAPNGTYTLRFTTTSDLVCPSFYLKCAVLPCCAVPCRAVPCRAVPCRAVPCRAVLC